MIILALPLSSIVNSDCVVNMLVSGLRFGSTGFAVDSLRRPWLRLLPHLTLLKIDIHQRRIFLGHDHSATPG